MYLLCVRMRVRVLALVFVLVLVLGLARRGAAAVVEVTKEQVKNAIYAAAEIVLVKGQLVLPK